MSAAIRLAVALLVVVGGLVLPARACAAEPKAGAPGQLVLFFTGDNGGEVAPCG